MSNLSNLSIFSKKKKIVALDVGRVFLGVALSDSTRALAFPYTVLKWESKPGILVDFLHTLMNEEMIELVVLGQPMVFDGFNNHNNGANAAVDTVLKILANTYPKIPIEMVDERVSTIEADNRMADVGITRGRRDAVAAQIILERYLESLT